MDLDLIRQIRNKENKTETEWELLRYYYTFIFVTEILVDESKWHISSEKAIDEIRECLNENLY